MFSARLNYEPLEPTKLEAFHSLVRDEHVRRYLLDGQIMERAWSEERIRASQALFDRRGVGLWLSYDKRAELLVGFCGFLEFPDIHPEPQLVYAMFERYSGKGYATEMSRAAIACARDQGGFDEIIACVDEVNGASLHVLHKLGFERLATLHGCFGDMPLLRLAGEPRSDAAST